MPLRDAPRRHIARAARRQRFRPPCRFAFAAAACRNNATLMLLDTAIVFRASAMMSSVIRRSPCFDAPRLCRRCRCSRRRRHAALAPIFRSLFRGTFLDFARCRRRRQIAATSRRCHAHRDADGFFAPYCLFALRVRHYYPPPLRAIRHAAAAATERFSLPDCLFSLMPPPLMPF